MWTPRNIERHLSAPCPGDANAVPPLPDQPLKGSKMEEQVTLTTSTKSLPGAEDMLFHHTAAGSHRVKAWQHRKGKHDTKNGAGPSKFSSNLSRGSINGTFLSYFGLQVLLLQID